MCRYCPFPGTYFSGGSGGAYSPSRNGRTGGEDAGGSRSGFPYSRHWHRKWCIAVTLSKELPEAEVTAWDISGEALAIAGDNNRLLQTSVQFVQRDVLTYQPAEDEYFDVIVSNPPYVTETEKKDMEPNVLNWEPSGALFVPDSDPLRFYRRIGELGRSMLTVGGRLYFEINRAFGEAVASMLRKQGYTNVRIRKDISGNDRYVIAER